jgi:hypothetical protein
MEILSLFRSKLTLISILILIFNSTIFYNDGLAQNIVLPQKTQDTISQGFILDPVKIRENIYNNIPDIYKKGSYERKSIAFAANAAYIGHDELLGEQFYYNNDSLIEYLDAIIKRVIPQNLLTENSKVYVVKEGRFNAYVMSGGQIVLNIGIFDNIYDEACIAAIIAHEFAHYYLNHMFKLLILEEKTNLSLLMINAQKKINQYHVKTEIQADSLAFVFLNQSGYDPLAMVDVLNLILFYEKRYLMRDGNYSYYRETTHPDIKKRTEYIKQLKNKHQTQSGERFLISSDKFHLYKQNTRKEILQSLLDNMNYRLCQEMSFKYHIMHPADPDFYYYLLESIRRYCYGNPSLWFDNFITSNYYFDSKANTRNVSKRKIDYPLLSKFEPTFFSMIPEDTLKVKTKFYWDGSLPFSTYEEAFNYFFKISQRFNSHECVLSNALSFTRDTVSRNHYLRKYLLFDNIKNREYAELLLNDSVYSSLPSKKLIVLNSFETNIGIDKHIVPLFPSNFLYSNDINILTEKISLCFPDVYVLNMHDVRSSDLVLYQLMLRMMDYSFGYSVSSGEIIETHILFPEYYNVFKTFGVNELEFVNLLYFERFKTSKDTKLFWTLVEKTSSEILSNNGTIKYLDVIISGLRICKSRASMFLFYNPNIKMNEKLSGYEAIVETFKSEYSSKEWGLKNIDRPPKQVFVPKGRY